MNRILSFITTILFILSKLGDPLGCRFGVVLMIDDPVLIDDWHPAARVADMASGRPLGVRVLGEDVVLWRAGGTILAWQDLCIHRGTRLSLGRIDGDTIECPYHGWTYGTAGRCVATPAPPDQRPPARAVVRTYQAIEKYGMIWVSLGEPVGEVP